MTTTGERAASVTDAGRGAGDLDAGGAPDQRTTAVLGWVAVAVLSCTLLATWFPLAAPFGDDHDGRTLVLNAIQVEQLRERGLLDTDLGSSLAPYVEARSYAHHPPAMKLPYLAASYLPVSLETSTRLVSYTLGALTLPALALLLRRLRVPWGAVLVALAAVAALPMFWAYGRLHGPLGSTVLLAAVVADLRTRAQVGPTRLAAACLLAAFVAAANWLSLAAAALLGLWLLAGRRRLDGVVLAVGASMAVAAAVTLVWVLAVAGADEVTGSVAERATDPGFTRGEWVERIGRWVDELVPVWWRVLAVLGVLGALLARRVRAVALAALVLALGWVVALPGGSYVHDYWMLPLAVPLGLGLAGAAALVLDHPRATPRLDRALTVAAGLAGVGAVLALSAGPFGAAYETAPRAMPRAAAQALPPATQQTAWHAPNVPGRLTVAWAWDRPAAPLDAVALDAAPAGDHVVVELERVPGVTSDSAAVREAALATAGGYGVVTVGDLRALREQEQG